MNKANTYFNQHFYPVNNNGRKEDKSYSVRQRWRELGFPSYASVDEDMGLPKNTTANYASKYGYKQIKETYQELQEQEKSEIEEKEQKELVETFKEIWNTTINDTKYQLQSITQEIQKVENQIQNTDDVGIKKELHLKLDNLWEKHNNIVVNKFPKLQDKARTNLGLTNSYKDTSIDKLEVEQKGELTLNQNISNETEEEKLERYANYFKQIKGDINDSTNKEINK